MTPKESLLATAIHNLFMDDPKILGIAKGKPPIHDDTNQMPHQYEYLSNLFKLKIMESLGDTPYFESISSAFYDIHSYRFIDDPKFSESLITKLKSMGIPQNAIKVATDKVQEIVKEMKNGNKEWDERSAGWHKNLEGVKKTSQEFNQKPEREEAASGGGPWPNRKELANITEDLKSEVMPDQDPYVDIGYSLSLDRILRDMKYKIDQFSRTGRLDAAKKYTKMVEEIEKTYKETHSEKSALRKYEEMLK